MRKILIIDDSLLERKLLTNTLKKAGLENEILQAADGEEGLSLLSRHYRDICVILLDWQMPKMNGLEFMRGAVQVPETASIPIIMITASGSDESQRQARAVNPRLGGYLVKPYQPQSLIELITPHLKG